MEVSSLFLLVEMLLMEVFLKFWVILLVWRRHQFEIISCADVVPGCTDANALNQNLDATHDDGSCDMQFLHY